MGITTPSISNQDKHASKTIKEMTTILPGRRFNVRQYFVLTNILLVFQLGLLIFSLLWPSSVYFFAFLKISIVMGFLVLLTQINKPIKSVLNETLVVLPGIWGVIIGVTSNNPGVTAEMAFYVLAPLSYLIAFRFISVSFMSLVSLIIKIFCVLNIAVFFFLFLSEGGWLYDFLQRRTEFVIQYLPGYSKVFTLQATQLIFLLPVSLMYFYFKKNVLNFILLAACLLMALLIGRKAILILFCLLFLILVLYSIYQKSNSKDVTLLFFPVIISIVAFFNLSDFDNKKYVDGMFNSFPSFESSEPSRNIQIQMLTTSEPSRNTQIQMLTTSESSWQDLYDSKDNLCSLVNIKSESKLPDKLGAEVRNIQIQMLTKSIYKSPWLGNGIGSVTPSCVRSAQQPWRFEMTYLTIAKDIGLLGLFLLSVVYLRWTLSVMHSSLDKSVSFPLLAGSLFFIICSTTNPYIMSVEGIFLYFMPYMLVQVERRKLKHADRSVVVNEGSH